MNRGILQEQLMGRLAGGFSLREAKEVVPVPGSSLPIARETLRIVDTLCELRGFNYHDIWERLITVVQSVDLEITSVNTDEDLEVVSACPHLGIAINNLAKEMDLPVEDLINTGVIKLIDLLHVVDNEEYDTIQQVGIIVRDAKDQLEDITDWLENEWSKSPMGLFHYTEQAVDILFEAQQVINSYLFDHAVSPKESMKALSEVKDSRVLITAHEYP